MRTLAIILFFVCFVVSAVPIQFPKRGLSDDMVNKMLCMVNQRRAQDGKSPLAFHPSLNSAAQKHSDYQARINTMTHSSPFGGLGDRDTASGFPSISGAAENVAAGFHDVEAVVNAWFNSAGHLANILSDNVYFGAGESNGYWTQEFATPMDRSNVPANVPVCPGSSNSNNNNDASNDNDDRIAHNANNNQQPEQKEQPTPTAQNGDANNNSPDNSGENNNNDHQDAQQQDVAYATVFVTQYVTQFA